MRLSAPSTLLLGFASVLHLLQLVPLVAAAETTITEEHKRVKADFQGLDEPDSRPGLVEFSLHQDDESYAIAIGGLPSTEAYQCQPEDLLNVTVNSQALSDPLLPYKLSDEDILSAVIGTVNVATGRDNQAHQVKLLIEAACHTSDKVHNLGYHPLAFYVSIVGIDGARWTGPALRFEAGEHLESASIVIKQASAEQADWYETKASSAALNKLPASASDKVEFAADVIEQEIQKLRELQEELRTVQQSVNYQKTLVDSLAKDKLHDAKKAIEDCESVSCVLKTIYHKSKECIHLAYLRFKPMGADQVSACSNMYDLSGQSNSKGGGFEGKDYYPLYNGQDSPTGIPKSFTEKVDPDRIYTSEDSSNSFRRPLSGSTSSRSRARADTAHAVFAIAASFLCLACLTACVHRRCCNPRARADRAARREERRTRRQYRCAARKQAWSEWWNRKYWWQRNRGTWDYEEKRALIVPQETILENAMQEEIGRLGNIRPVGVVTEVLTMAEEGRIVHPRRSQPSPTRSDSTLPPYRSRSGSGRPPSYNEFDENHASLVPDGFTNYEPSSTTSGNDDARSVRSFVTDRTPESSIVDLSPRHSSETLRTERSVL